MKNSSKKNFPGKNNKDYKKNSDFGYLVAGDAITVDSTAYTVRTNEAGLDGLTRQISLQKN